MLPLPKDCRGCPIDHKEGYSIVSGDGSTPLMVIAEASGRNEARLGRPLIETAPAGGVFQKALDLSGLSRDVLSLTNILRCQPPGNELRGATYEREAIDHCRQYLDAAVAERQPKLILALGDIPLRELSTTSGSISSLRGFVLQSIYGVPMIATYHPSFLARGATHLFGVFLHDIQRAHQFATRGIPQKVKTNYVTSPTSSDVSNYLDRLRSDNSLPIAYDIETASILGEKEAEDWREKRIIQIQFSSGVGEALVIPWSTEYVDAEMMELVGWILETPNMKWGWNDRLSDRLALKRYVKIGGEQHDLMNAWAHLQPNFMSAKDDAHGDKGVPAKLMSLQSCVSFYYPQEGPWKGMVQRAVEDAKAEWEQTVTYDATDFATNDIHNSGFMISRVGPVLKHYGARDADLTFRVGMRLFDSLKKLGLW